MSRSWILIANASKACIYATRKARLFKTNGHAEDTIKLVQQFSHGKSRKKTSELVSDRVGAYQTGNGGHGSFVEPSDPKEIEADRFAHELVEVLAAGHVEGQYDDLIIVANPRFHGLLNKHLGAQLHRLVSKVIEKDYTHMKGRQLAQQLSEQI